MQPTRKARLESQIQEELTLQISRNIKDPRVPLITITRVELTSDGKQATVFVTLFGGLTTSHSSESNPERDKKMKECIDGLRSAAGYLRRQLAKLLNIKHIPTLLFREDVGLENSLKVREILKKIADERSAS